MGLIAQSLYHRLLRRLREENQYSLLILAQEWVWSQPEVSEDLAQHKMVSGELELSVVECMESICEALGSIFSMNKKCLQSWTLCSERHQNRCSESVTIWKERQHMERQEGSTESQRITKRRQKSFTIDGGTIWHYLMTCVYRVHIIDRLTSPYLVKHSICIVNCFSWGWPSVQVHESTGA